MFPPGSEGFDMSQLLQQAQRMQERLMSAQQDLSEAEATGSAGGGLVRATVTGGGELTALEIDRSVVDPDDVDTLADLVIAAVRDAHSQLQQRASEQLGGLDPSALFGGGQGGASPLAGLFGGGAAASLPDDDDDEDDEDDDAPGDAPRRPGA